MIIIILAILASYSLRVTYITVIATCIAMHFAILNHATLILLNYLAI